MPTEVAGPPIAHPEIIEVDTDKIGCDGGGGALGHPLVYLTMTASGQVECPYCSRLFVKRGQQATHLPQTPGAPGPQPKP